MKNKLDNDILDLLIDKIAKSSLECTQDACGDSMSQSDKIEYMCRAYSEILGVLITAAPQAEVQNVCNNICKFLQAVVSRNLQMSELFGVPIYESGSKIEEIFKDTIYVTSKKAEA